MNEPNRLPEACAEFRRLLEQALRSWVDDRPATDELSWHAHLGDCDACRRLVAEEHALDELLAVWREGPEATLPLGLAERVLSRLESSRGLDRLLDLPGAPDVPSGLSSRILANLVQARSAAEDAALDRVLGEWQAPVVPSSLSSAILAGLEHERHDDVIRARPRLALVGGWGLAAVAAGVLAFLGWKFVVSSPERQIEPIDIAATGEGKEDESELVQPNTTGRVSDELLLALDVLERWDEVTDEEFDAVLNAIDEELEDDTAEDSFWVDDEPEEAR